MSKTNPNADKEWAAATKPFSRRKAVKNPGSMENQTGRVKRKVRSKAR